MAWLEQESLATQNVDGDSQQNWMTDKNWPDYVSYNSLK